jgi:hypothetical protein
VGFAELVEACLIQQFVQPPIEWMARSFLCLAKRSYTHKMNDLEKSKEKLNLDRSDKILP